MMKVLMFLILMPFHLFESGRTSYYWTRNQWTFFFLFFSIMSLLVDFIFTVFIYLLLFLNFTIFKLTATTKIWRKQDKINREKWAIWLSLKPDLWWYLHSCASALRQKQNKSKCHAAPLFPPNHKSFFTIKIFILTANLKLIQTLIT